MGVPEVQVQQPAADIPRYPKSEHIPTAAKMVPVGYLTDTFQGIVPDETTAPPNNGKTGPPIDPDDARFPSARKFLNRCQDFFAEIEDLTPGYPTEQYLNKHYGPGNPIYDDFVKYIKLGLEEGWAANYELDGPHYRRSKVATPSAENRWFSITTVYLESMEEFRGQYHLHPYGELNCVIPLTEGAEIEGMQNWQGAGWTCPGAGTHHYPAVRGGALVALFFLPAGRISYKARPNMPQPLQL